MLSDVYGAVDRLLEQKTPAVIALDGGAASGKTSLSRLLENKYGARTVHMDDFFLPFNKRTAERLNEPGGNVDYERFISEALPFLPEGAAFSYAPFDCSFGKLSKPVYLPKNRLTIVEGAYSMHNRLRHIYDLSIFLFCSAGEQLSRLTKRNPEMLDRFIREWIPYENKYFLAMQVPENCDICLDTTGFF